MNRLFFCGLILASLPAVAQNRFVDPIPVSDIRLQIEDFATIPDSLGRPPRVNMLTVDPVGRLFVNDQRGPMYSIDSTGETVTEYLDLRDFTEEPIFSTSEAGFQSFAFHPDFYNQGSAGFGRFYTLHSSRNTTPSPDFDPGPGLGTPFHSLLLEWKTDTPDADSFSASDPDTPFREIMRLNQPFNNHNAGLIAFNATAAANDADFGNLYVGVGDGGSGADPQENGEDPSNPYGAILRINPLGTDSANGNYGIVSQNVLAADNDANTLSEIYAYGLRNPQRFAWDSANGNLFIADIGQGIVEEINLGANGANFGWDHREGSFARESNLTTGLTDPVSEYDHTNVVSDFPNDVTGGRAITTGDVARGTEIPLLEGHLPISDFPSGLLFVLDVDSDPLDGGQDGLAELQPLTEDMSHIRMIDLINEARDNRGLSSASRADTRFSINTPGQVFIVNKQDGIVRRLTSVTGDFTDDGWLTVDDVNLLMETISAGTNDAEFELTGDGLVDKADLKHWVDNLKKTWFGDANLDGEFNTTDLTEVFVASEFEDGVPLNSTWATGDWDADGDFTTSDLVRALQDGGFSIGPRTAKSQTVPETTGLLFVAVLFSSVLLVRRR